MERGGEEGAVHVEDEDADDVAATATATATAIVNQRWGHRGRGRE